MLTRSYPSDASQNVTYTYDQTTGGNFGVSRLTATTHSGGSTAITYDARGNIASETRTISGQSYTVSYDYDAADQITHITYPSGREVLYTRDSEARIVAVGTRANGTLPYMDLATNINYQPLSRLVQAMDFGNGLNTFNTYTNDYELDVLGLYDGQTDVINRAHTRTDNTNLTNIFDNVTSANNQTFWYTGTHCLQNADGPWGSKTFYYDGVGNLSFPLKTKPVIL